jgi:hypothetical protein
MAGQQSILQPPAVGVSGHSNYHHDDPGLCSLSLTHTHTLSLARARSLSLSHTHTHIKLLVYRKQRNYCDATPPHLGQTPLVYLATWCSSPRTHCAAQVPESRDDALWRLRSRACVLRALHVFFLTSKRSLETKTSFLAPPKFHEGCFLSESADLCGVARTSG